MLSNNNHNHKSCAFAEQIISYLYGEINAADKNKFETHLKSCLMCADELEEISAVRSSVHDWRIKEFSILETPTFHIPSNNRAESFSTTSVSTETTSWYGNLRRMFSFNPARATAALGVLVVCIGIALFLIRLSDTGEVAQNRDKNNSVQTIVSPSVESKKEKEEKNIIGQPDEKSALFKDHNLSTETKSEKQIAPSKSIVKVSNNTVPRTDAINSARNSKDANDGIKKTSPVQKRRVPTLTDTDEDEDDSIRLADLFAEIDAK